MALFFTTLLGDLTAGVAILAAIAFYFVQRQYTYWQRRAGFTAALPVSFPGGSFQDWLRQRVSVVDRVCDIYNSTDLPFVGIWAGLQPQLFLRDPEIIRSVLIRDFQNFSDRGLYSDAARDPLSGNLFRLPPAEWRHMRQKLSPAFTSGKLKAMFQTLVDCGAPLDRHLNEQATAGNVLELRELVAQLMTNIIASVAFGLDIDCIADVEEPFRYFGRKVFEASRWNAFRNTFMTFAPTLFGWLRLRAFDRDVEEFFMSVVRENLRMRESQQQVRKDFFQLLVQLRNKGLQSDDDWTADISGGGEANKQLSIQQCAAQSFVFYVAGFETSSATVSYALYELAKNPECQRRVQQEIDAVLQRHDGQITYDSVYEMVYLGWCIDGELNTICVARSLIVICKRLSTEALRKYPPLPMLHRRSIGQWSIPNADAGQSIEPGTVVVIPTTALHYDPKYYPDPNRFDPERFSPERMAGKSFLDQPYLPFGEGPRNCIGLRLGKEQTRVALVLMLQKYWYDLASNTLRPLVMNPASMFPTPVGGINLRVTHRVKADFK